jgi:SAM-dependent methyltransferase
MSTHTSAPVDEAKVDEFMARFVADMGAIASAPLVRIGDRLGLYRALADGGPATPAELAQRTGCSERYLREWLLNQGASGYASYDPQSGRYFLTPEQEFVLTQPDSPAHIMGAFQIAGAMYHDEAKIEERFRNGDGLDWGDHDHELFEGTDRFFAPSYRASLVTEWLPALDGVVERLEAGTRVADVGCGYGTSTLLMAQAFPKSEFIGFDNHRPSIDAAQRRADAAGLTDRVTFQAADAEGLPGEYGFAACFDCLHDMGDPVGAARAIHRALDADGTWMIVEPYANDRPEENMNPVGRIFSAASTAVCVPHSLAHEGVALGAQAGEARLADVARSGGFSRVRRAAETPFNLVLEARP